MISRHSQHLSHICPVNSTSSGLDASPHDVHCAGRAFMHDHAAGFIELGWLTVGIVGALLWLSLLVLTGFSAVVLSLGLLVCLLLTASR